ncbi:MAG: hypothetical protein EB084_18710 [Proteobacteria bacterium]|nr:hypothetical protein [Pseudomonadota bacterium]
MVYSPKADFIYGACFFSSNIVIDGYSVDPQTGNLAKLTFSLPNIPVIDINVQPAMTGYQASSAMAYLYVLLADKIYTYIVDDQTGNLTALSGQPFSNSDYVGTSPVLYTGRQMAVYNRAGSTILYVANNATGDLTRFKIDAFGALQVPLTSAAQTTGSNPFAVAIHPTLDVLYQIDSTSMTLSSWQINPTDGALTQIQGGAQALTAVSKLENLAVSPDGKHLWITGVSASIGGGGVGFSLDPNTGVPNSGAMTALSNEDGVGLAFLQFDPLTTLLFMSSSTNNNVDAFNPSTGLLLQSAALTSPELIVTTP